MSRIDDILEHIIEDCQDIENFIKGISYEEFINNIMIQKAVAMSLINIGELVKSLPKDFCEANSELPWRRIAGMRDLVAHKYKTLNMKTVWLVAVEHIPEIKSFIHSYRSRTK